MIPPIFPLYDLWSFFTPIVMAFFSPILYDLPNLIHWCRISLHSCLKTFFFSPPFLAWSLHSDSILWVGSVQSDLQYSLIYDLFTFRFGMTSHSIVCYDPFPPIFTSSFQYDPSSALRSLQYSLLDDLALFPPSSTISLRSDLYLLSSISFVLRFRSLHFPVCYWPFHSVLDLFKILSVLWRIISFFQVCYDLFTPVGHDLFPILTLSL